MAALLRGLSGCTGSESFEELDNRFGAAEAVAVPHSSVRTGSGIMGEPVTLEAFPQVIVGLVAGLTGSDASCGGGGHTFTDVHDEVAVQPYERLREWCVEVAGGELGRPIGLQ